MPGWSEVCHVGVFMTRCLLGLKFYFPWNTDSRTYMSKIAADEFLSEKKDRLLRHRKQIQLINFHRSIIPGFYSLRKYKSRHKLAVLYS